MVASQQVCGGSTNKLHSSPGTSQAKPRLGESTLPSLLILTSSSTRILKLREEGILTIALPRLAICHSLYSILLFLLLLSIVLFFQLSSAQLSLTLCVIYVIHRSRQLDNTQLPTNILTPGIRTHLIPLLLLSQFVTVLPSNCSNPSYPNHFVQPQFCIPTVVDLETRYLSLILSVTQLKYLPGPRTRALKTLDAKAPEAYCHPAFQRGIITNKFTIINSIDL